MQKTLLFKVVLSLLLAVFVSAALPAQSRAKTPNLREAARRNPALLTAKPKLKPATGFEVLPPAAPLVPPSESLLRQPLKEEVYGFTYYDIQSNGAETPRLHAWTDDDVTGTYIQALESETAGWSDRGTGYNRRDKWLANQLPTGKLEASFRTGFSNYLVTANGTEFIVNHRAINTSTYKLHFLRRAAGQTAWTEGDLPTNTPNGLLWPVAAVDGNTIHVVAQTSPDAAPTITGTVYKGVNGHVLYYRSQDGGQSWDIIDGIVPGLDSSAYASISAQTYTVEAQNGLVVVGIFDSWNDMKIWKSDDNGSTWQPPITIFDFPLDKYVADQGYTTNDIPLDTNAVNPLAIFTYDGNPDLIVDNGGFVHVWMGEMYVMDTVLTDGGTTYYPFFTNALIHWSELAPDEVNLVGYTRDYDNSDTLDLSLDVAKAYGTTTAGMPAAGVDANNNLYVAYSAFVENFFDDTGNSLRHIYLSKSYNDGVDWTEPLDIHWATNEEPDSFFAKRAEGVFPSMIKNVGQVLHFSYQRDDIAGAAVLKTGVQANEGAQIVYVRNDDAVGALQPARPNLDVTLSPNPAADFTRLSFDLEQAGAVAVSVVDAAGRTLAERHFDRLQAGTQNLVMPVSNLAPGLYFLQLRSGNRFASEKLAIGTR